MSEANHNSIIPHQYFEELCALAPTGDLREDEWTQLDEHLARCADCRRLRCEFEQKFLVLMEASSDSSPLSHAVARQLFVARARSAGIPLSPRTDKPEHNFVGRRRFPYFQPMAACGIALGIIFVLILSFHEWPDALSRGIRDKPTPPVQEPRRLKSSLELENEQLRGDLSREKAQAVVLIARAKQVEADLESISREKSKLADRISELQKSNAAMRDEQVERGTEFAKLRDDLENVREEEKTQRTALLAAQAELKSARFKVADLESELSASQEQNAALSEAHDLIVARKLHVLNIKREVDENGNPRGPFGRIFYTEGQKLAFYAYDLNDPHKLNTKSSFYLWGETPDTVQRVVSLGKFQLDSQQDGRWVLRVTDGRLLSQVRSVFVTSEAEKKPVAQPTGKRMLSRLLRADTDQL